MSRKGNIPKFLYPKKWGSKCFQEKDRDGDPIGDPIDSYNTRTAEPMSRYGLSREVIESGRRANSQL